MEAVSFIYNGKPYRSNVKVSVTKEPFYFWCYLQDADLKKELGECVVFRSKKGVISTTHYYPTKYKSLLNNLENAVSNYLAEHAN